MPRVTVLLPVRNEAESLETALRSILEQRMSDLQLLVLDDASDDGSPEIAEGIGDTRIVVHRYAEQMGLSRILNEGLKLSDSEYVARMDADDWSYPERFNAQLDVLQRNPTWAACGCAVTVRMPDGSRKLCRYPVDHDAIRAKMLFENAMAHPTGMIRRRALERFGIAYDPDFLKCEDFDLWERMGRHCRLANLAKPYLDYQVRPRSAEHYARQREYCARIRLRQLEALGISPTPRQWNLHEALCTWDMDVVGQHADEMEDWFQCLLEANQGRELYDQQALRKEVLTRFRRFCRWLSRKGGGGWEHWHHAERLRSGEFRLWDYLRLPLWYSRS